MILARDSLDPDKSKDTHIPQCELRRKTLLSFNHPRDCTRIKPSRTWRQECDLHT